MIAIIQVQVLLLSKFIQLNQNSSDLSEYYYVFESLQRKMKALRSQVGSEDILGQGLDSSRLFLNLVDKSLLSPLSLLLYHINVYEFDDEDDLELFWLRILQVKEKRQKVMNQENTQSVILYATNLLLEKCCRMISSTTKIDAALKVVLQIKNDRIPQFNSQVNLCVLLAYFRLNLVDDFLEYSKTLEQKQATIEVQTLVLVVNIRQLIHEADFEKQLKQHQKLFTNFIELNILHQVSDVLIVINELTHNYNTAVFALRTITIWLKYKYNLLQKSANANNISKTANDLQLMLDSAPQVLQLNFPNPEFEVIREFVAISVLELTQDAVQMAQHLQKSFQINCDQLIIFILDMLPKLISTSDRGVLKSAGQLISALATIQLQPSQAIIGLSIYLNTKFDQLPQTHSFLFQQIIKNYKEGFTTAVLLFIKEFQDPKSQENRPYVTSQLKTLLEQSYKLFEQTPIPLYALLEASVNSREVFHLEVVFNFFLDSKINYTPQLFQFLIDHLSKLNLSHDSNNFNIDRLFIQLYEFLSNKPGVESGLVQQIHNICLERPRTLQKSWCLLLSYFLIQMNLTNTSVGFIKETILALNQYKYQWKQENNKSLLLYLIEVLEYCDRTADAKDVKSVIETTFFIVENNTREEVTQLVPFVLRLVMRVSILLNLEDIQLRALYYSLKIENLFNLLLAELVGSESKKQIKLVLKRLIYENNIPILPYFQVIYQLIDLSQTIEEITELLPQLNQLLRSSLLDELIVPYAQIIYLKLNSVQEYIPFNKMEMFTQSINLLMTKF